MPKGLAMANRPTLSGGLVSTFQPLADATIPGLAAESAPTPAPPTCPRCGQPVRHVVDDETAGWPVTVTRHPVDRTTALAALTVGRDVIVHRPVRRSAYWRRLDRHTLGSANLAAGDHHLEHRCGHDPPPPPARARAADYPTPPPY